MLPETGDDDGSDPNVVFRLVDFGSVDPNLTASIHVLWTDGAGFSGPASGIQLEANHVGYKSWQVLKGLCH